MKIRTRTNAKKNQGQALTEFALMSVIVTSLILLVGSIFRDEWQKTRCAYLVFEATHARLIGKSTAPVVGTLVRVVEDRNQFRGSGICGHAREMVELRKLEAISW